MTPSQSKMRACKEAETVNTDEGFRLEAAARRGERRRAPEEREWEGEKKAEEEAESGGCGGDKGRRSWWCCSRATVGVDEALNNGILSTQFAQPTKQLDFNFPFVLNFLFL